MGNALLVSASFFANICLVSIAFEQQEEQMEVSIVLSNNVLNSGYLAECFQNLI
jgi:hypothetical protein